LVREKPELEALTLEKGSAFFWSSNYSIGVNIFFKLNKMLAKLMSPQKQYSVSTTEIHHTEKKDSPSGTAITIAEGLIENLAGKEKWINNEIPAENEVAIWSAREGKVPERILLNIFLILTKSKFCTKLMVVKVLHWAQ
jgi:4-hydroxy-tetrahydrodipicolinate reductase